MTRETKIGLLVGLAFMIVVGILVTGLYQNNNQTPLASLDGSGNSVRNGVLSPGTANPPIDVVIPPDPSLHASVPTREEVSPPTGPVILHQPPIAQAQTPQTTVVQAPIRTDTPVIAPTNDTPPADAAPAQVPMTAGFKMYKAQSGDTLSKMAARLMGANTQANRQAIIKANPGLQDDPDWIEIGTTYKIPASASASSAPAAPAIPDTVPVDADPAPAPAPAADSTYTVQEGDSLWRIANDVVGDPGAVSTLQQLNRDVLKGDNHDVVIVGMKLRLPPKPVASAN